MPTPLLSRSYPARRGVRRRQSGIHGTLQRRPTLWIGMIMFVLMIAYVAVVVTVARSSYTKESYVPPKSPSYDAAADVIHKAPPAPKDPHLAVPPTHKEETETKALTQSPVRKHHLENPFGHGVDPHILLAHEGKAPIVMFKDDPKDHPTPDYVLTAYLEKQNMEDWDQKPLPERQYATKDQLQAVRYSRLSSCSKLTQQFPIDDTPTDHDAFLPWIHDVFPTQDGRYIQFVAQNKRRCKTGKKEGDILTFMEPQASLFQHVPIMRDNGRYRVVSHEQADADGLATRYICRFKPSMEETLSEFNFDYDWTAYRKRYRHTFAKEDGGIKHLHTTQLIFRCPVPASLQEKVRTGETVQDDWASLFVDLIPIRTPPRYGAPNDFLQPQYKSFENPGAFDAAAQFGPDGHLLPALEDSGRWENIPICKPSLMTYGTHANETAPSPVDAKDKKHRLVSCLWVSAGYTTRGERFAVNDGQRRLLEWITYNKILGFDHFYLYDNSGAFGTEMSLQPIAELYPDDVTYIPWPAQICNNRPNNVDSPGERSSQYAAESSCRLRFGPHVDWIGQFDPDEYFVPMGDYNTATELLDKLEMEDTRMINFGSWRAWPRKDFLGEIHKIEDNKICWSSEPCFNLQVPMEFTMLQAYNCDRNKPGEKQTVMPAEKQFYRPDYVLQHFVHFSVATVLSEKNKTEYEKEKPWGHRPFPDPRQRFADEVTEGLMIHSKAVAIQDTAGYERVCHINNTDPSISKRKRGLCRLGIPWPDELGAVNATTDGWAYNCFVNRKVEDVLIPKLNEQMAKFAHIFDQQ